MKKYEGYTAWIAETVDYIKDVIYTVAFKHKLFELLVLTFSLTFPFAAFEVHGHFPPDHHAMKVWGVKKDRRKYMIENLLDFFRISYEKDKSTR